MLCHLASLMKQKRQQVVTNWWNLESNWTTYFKLLWTNSSLNEIVRRLMMMMRGSIWNSKCLKKNYITKTNIDLFHSINDVWWHTNSCQLWVYPQISMTSRLTKKCLKDITNSCQKWVYQICIKCGFTNSCQMWVYQ